MRKMTFLLLSTVLMSSVAYAGGHIFGGGKHKTANVNGVYSIGVHICSSLECPDIRIVEGDCTGDYMSKHYGVCVCDKGYVASGDHCDPCPAGQVSDGISGCKTCPAGTYRANATDTECTVCPTPTGTICNGTPATDTNGCPTQKLVECSGTTPICGTDNKTCECPTGCNCDAMGNITAQTGYYKDTATTCASCQSVDPKAITCNESGIPTDCEEGYTPQDNACVEIPTGPTCPGNSSATEITNGTSFEVTEETESITCWCPEGQSYQSTGCADAPTDCNDYENNVCGLGYYCKFTPSDCGDSDRGNGVCTAISGGTQKGGHWVGPKLDWWSANSWCIGKGSTGSITYSTLQSAYGCDKSSYSCNWSALNADGLSDYYWSAELYDSCDAWNVYVVIESFYNVDRASSRSALCE